MVLQKDAKDIMDEACEQRWDFGEDASKEEAYT